MQKTFKLFFPDEITHKKLKMLCVVEGVTMNQKILELIIVVITKKVKKIER